MNSKKKELVTVIAVCYNHEKYLLETLNSIKNQTYKNIELVIMDDYSSDNSVEVIKSWIKKNNYQCKFIAHEKNQGLCKTLNEALTFCNGDYIQLTSCDDILLSHKIQFQVDKLNELSVEYGAIYSDALFIDENSNEVNINFINYYTKKRKSIKLSGNIFDELVKGNFIPAMSVLMRREVVQNVGKYDENLAYEDYDYWLRVAKKYYFFYVENSLVKYRIHSNNLHKKITSEQWNNSGLQIAIKHLDNEVFFNGAQNGLINLFFKNNDRVVIDDFYQNLGQKKLKREVTHFCIKNNFPKLLVKLVFKVESFFIKYIDKHE